MEHRSCQQSCYQRRAAEPPRCQHIPPTKSRTLRGLLFHVPRSSQTAPNSCRKMSHLKNFGLPAVCGDESSGTKPLKIYLSLLFTNSIPRIGPHSLQRGSPHSHLPSQSTESHVSNYDLPATGSNSQACTTNPTSGRCQAAPAPEEQRNNPLPLSRISHRKEKSTAGTN